MNKIIYRKTTKADMKILMKLRLEMLREVNGLSGEYEYDENFIFESRRYFESGEQTTVIASDGETLVGCASLSYTWIMPTFSHPTGNRAHLMNVYTRADYRRRGISKKMVEILIDEAKENGVTEISLDATEMGRPLYESLGFKASDSCMVMDLEGGY
jgi:GNAT superfamily N-acetyltransferase